MGAIRDNDISLFREAAGIQPAKGSKLALLREMQSDAFELIKQIELEISGIRDGDCKWYSSDPISGIVTNMTSVNFQIENDVSRKTADLASIPMMTPAEARAFEAEEAAA
jgi:hypothetical protein